MVAYNRARGHMGGILRYMLWEPLNSKSCKCDTHAGLNAYNVLYRALIQLCF